MLSPSKRRLAMMFSQMTNDDLMVKFHECVRSERKIAHHVLEYIAEIETRQLYLGRGYPSLHAFLREACGYSEGAATRRIAGARLLRQIPDIATKLEAGTINLSQLVQIQATCRESEKQNRQPVTVEQKRQILAKVESATSAQTQVIAAESLGCHPGDCPQTATSCRPLGDHHHDVHEGTNRNFKTCARTLFARSRRSQLG